LPAPFQGEIATVSSMRALAALLLLAGSTPALLAVGAPAVATRPTTAPGLETWLPRLDRVASLYRGTALSFTCTELMSWVDRNGRARRQRFEYVYVDDEQQGLKDYRMDPSLRTDLAATHEVRPADYGVPRYVENGFSWIVLFQRSRWGSHRYEFLGEGRALKRAAVRIGFRPIPPYRKGVNEWEGEAWFDRETAQILRVEARRPGDYPQNPEQLMMIGNDPALRLRVIADYKIEKHGMRFPGLIRLELVHVDPGTGASIEASVPRVEQEYRNYRFFEVRTAAEIHELVFGADAVQPDAQPAPSGDPPPP
jgi:hypothetical protein